MTTIQEIDKKFKVEQVLVAFDIHPNYANKILCPSHQETEPSCQVNEDFLYCYGCHSSWSVFGAAKLLLEKRDEREYTIREVLTWFETTTFSTSTKKYHTHEYLGPVPSEYISYWADECMVEESYRTLEEERLITKETAKKYKIGWRPDYGAWSIPFWRGEPGNSEVDIVQFRKVTGKPKYIGLAGHNRGSVMNAHLLEKELPFLVVMFHAFDPILALQEGLYMVGTNGSFPFKKTEKSRVQELFAKQKNIFIVPDNNPSEYEPAYKLAEWIGGQVKYFPTELPHNTDYIDYRHMGYSKEEFMRDVLQLTAAPEDIVENIKELIKVGDPYNLAWVHAVNGSKKSSPQAVAQAVVYSGPLVYSEQQWQQICKPLQQVTTEDDLYRQMQEVSKISYGFNGGW